MFFYNANKDLHKNVNDSNEFCKLARAMKNDSDYLTKRAKRDVILRLYINFISTTNHKYCCGPKHLPSTYLYFDISICISNN